MSPPLATSSFPRRPEIRAITVTLAPRCWVLAMPHGMSWIIQRVSSLLRDFQTPPPPTTTNNLFLSKETGESVCKCFKGGKVYSQQMMPWRNSKGPGKRQNHGFEGNFLMRWNLRGHGEIFWCEPVKRLKCSISPWQGEMSCQGPREKVKKMFFVIEKLFDKLPDITGLILPSLDRKN